jgi:hypothetical protein
VHLASTRPAGGRPRAWPAGAETFLERDTHTTSCFLTLPRKAQRVTTYPLYDEESDSGGGGFTVLGAMSGFVNIPAPETQGRIAKRFSRARHTLSLTPYIHESQLDRTFDAAEDVEEVADHPPILSTTPEQTKAVEKTKSSMSRVVMTRA